MKPKSEPPLPMTAYMSPQAREEFARSLEEVWRDYLGPERFEAYQRRLTPPAWLAKLPKLPERMPDGRLPSLS